MAVSQSSRAQGGRTFFGHPWGLATLFFTEMWERFSFYGMRSLLVLFLAAPVAQQGMGLSDGTASAVVGVYQGMVYFVALPGGWIADRILGARRSVLWGGVVIMMGHISLAIPGDAFVWIGLVLIVIGTGLLKPNISTMVGFLYRGENEARRDAGFSIFYMGINLGGFVAPFITGTLGQNVNWHLGFATAAVGMALGLIQYVLGGRGLGTAGLKPTNPASPETRRRFYLVLVATAVALVVVGGLSAAVGWFSVDNVTYAIAVFAVLTTVGFFLYVFRGKHGLTPVERSNMRAYIWLFTAAAIFWMIYDQAASVLSLFAQNNTDLSVFGWDMPSSWTQSINPVMIIALAPVFAALWVGPGRRFSTPAKFACALVLVGGSYVVMALVQSFADSGVKVTVLWMVLVYFLQTCGELALSPVGLAITTKLAPAKLASQMLGAWFLATAVGDAIGGQMARLKGTVLSGPMYFLFLGLLAVLAGIALFMFVTRLRRLMGEDAGDEAAAAV